MSQVASRIGATDRGRACIFRTKSCLSFWSSGSLPDGWRARLLRGTGSVSSATRQSVLSGRSSVTGSCIALDFTSALESDRSVSACHRRSAFGETGRRRGAWGHRSCDRPCPDVRRRRRSDHSARRGSGIRPGRYRSATPIDAGDQHVCPALDGPSGYPSRWGRHNISNDADSTAAAVLPSPHTSTSRFFIDEVDVEAAGQPGAVVTLGDSITDGYHSQVDGNHRWPDRLAERLAARADAAPVGVVNAGVSGNRILHDDHPGSFLARTLLPDWIATCSRRLDCGGSCSWRE
jgi:hypothetical protein